MLSLTVTGIQDVQNRLARFGTMAERAMLDALQQEAERILEASQPLVPVDTGLLRSTGLVVREPDGAAIRYGGFGLAPYAVPVHFRTDVRHPVGQAFYLQEPFFAATSGMLARLVATLRVV